MKLQNIHNYLLNNNKPSKYYNKDGNNLKSEVQEWYNYELKSVVKLIKVQ